MKTPYSLVHLTDEQLLLAVKTLARGERDATAQLIASLAELDARELYLAEGFPSLFAYCTQCLYLSEHAAYGRIAAAHTARKWPVILDLLAEGGTTLTTVSLLAPHLTTDNHLSLLEAARHRTRREVEAQVAALRPLPPVPSTHSEAAVTETDRRAAGDPRDLADAARRWSGDDSLTAQGWSAYFRTRVTVPCCHRHSARARNLQAADHHQSGNARQAAPGPGPHAALSPERGSGGDLRAGPGATAGGPAEEEAGPHEAAAPGTGFNARIAPCPSGCAA